MSRTTKFVLWAIIVGGVALGGIAFGNSSEDDSSSSSYIDATPVPIATALSTPMPTPIPTPAPVSVVAEENNEAEPDCNPNYSGCVPDVAYDLDCADIGHSVAVIGTDEYRLDRDQDGYGCESY